MVRTSQLFCFAKKSAVPCRADRIDPVFRTLQVGDTVVPCEDLVEVSGEGIMDIDAYLGIREE